MVPKVIHYCWLSNDPYPSLVERCLSSWKTQLPDYDFICWDITRAPDVAWVQEAFQQKKYAFAADYIRFHALYWHGGIYLDVDVEVIKSFNELLENDSFIGFDINGYLEGAVIGAKPGSSWIKACLDSYQDKHFIRDGKPVFTETVPLLIGEVLATQFGVQTGNAELFGRYDGLTLLPYTYFSPKSTFTQVCEVREETVCIHHFDGGWVKKTAWLRAKFYFHRWLLLFLGQRGHNRIIRNIRRTFASK